jgi:hypothetical protein
MDRDTLLAACRSAYEALDWRPVVESAVLYSDTVGAALPNSAGTLLVIAQRPGLSAVVLSRRVCDCAPEPGPPPYYRIASLSRGSAVECGPYRDTVAEAVEAWHAQMVDAVCAMAERVERGDAHARAVARALGFGRFGISEASAREVGP